MTEDIWVCAGHELKPTTDGYAVVGPVGSPLVGIVFDPRCDRDFIRRSLDNMIKQDTPEQWLKDTPSERCQNVSERDH